MTIPMNVLEGDELLDRVEKANERKLETLGSSYKEWYETIKKMVSILRRRKRNDSFKLISWGSFQDGCKYKDEYLQCRYRLTKGGKRNCTRSRCPRWRKLQ